MWKLNLMGPMDSYINMVNASVVVVYFSNKMVKFPCMKLWKKLVVWWFIYKGPLYVKICNKWINKFLCLIINKENYHIGRM